MEMVSEVNFKTLRSFQDHLGPTKAILEFFWSFLGPNLRLSQISHVHTFQIIWKLFRTLGSLRHFTPARHIFDEPNTFEIIQSIDPFRSMIIRKKEIKSL